MRNGSTWRKPRRKANWQGPMDSTSQHRRAATRRRPTAGLWLIVVVALAGFAVQGLCSVAHASNPGDFMSEIITPAGWELRTAPGRCSWVGDLSTSPEIITPEGWSDAGIGQPKWGGSVCSELVIPADWNRRGQYAN
jgi:hypothetical protein